MCSGLLNTSFAKVFTAAQSSPLFPAMAMAQARLPMRVDPTLGDGNTAASTVASCSDKPEACLPKKAMEVAATPCNSPRNPTRLK
jgi:hypothetical protein